jgi:hypothetical protein
MAELTQILAFLLHITAKCTSESTRAFKRAMAREERKENSI